MNSKTFKSAGNPEDAISVVPSADGVRTVHMHDIEASGVTVPREDAPALALAILEAVGVEAFGAGYLNKAVDCLQQHTREQERATAEARERAELEAEALELLNAEREEFSCTPVRDLSEVPARDQRAAIAVARRAREMRAEK